MRKLLSPEEKKERTRKRTALQRVKDFRVEQTAQVGGDTLYFVPIPPVKGVDSIASAQVRGNFEFGSARCEMCRSRICAHVVRLVREMAEGKVHVAAA